MAYSDLTKNKDFQRRYRANHRDKQRDYLREWRKQRTDSSRKYMLKAHYGLTPEQYDELYNAQAGKCKLCNKPPKGGPNSQYLVVDHDHTTDKVRGLLCQSCNMAIGLLGDTYEDVQQALDYLKE